MRRCALTLLLCVGCSQELPIYTEVVDLRVLGMSATPPTLLFDATAAPAVVSFAALVLDPRGGDLAYAWSFCPVESSRACADFGDIIGALPQPYVGDLVNARREGPSGVVAAPLDDEGQPDPLAAYAIPPFTLDFDAPLTEGGSETLREALRRFYRDFGFFGFGMGAWPSAVLRVRTSSGEEVVAQKRLVASLADLASENAFLAQQGGYNVRFCATDGETACLPWDPSRAGNDNPVFAEPAWSAGSSAYATWVPTGTAPASVAAGDVIRVLPTFAEDEVSYQLIRADLASGVISVEDAIEAVSVSWFVVGGGEVQDALTWPLFTKTLDTEYTAPPAAPAAGRARLWLVARDQRGGESWLGVEVAITP